VGAGGCRCPSRRVINTNVIALFLVVIMIISRLFSRNCQIVYGMLFGVFEFT
jgi:hypothetical protein